ncbi:MAG: hypothetical protein AAFX76_06905 [Planctomycetota bacterium]
MNESGLVAETREVDPGQGRATPGAPPDKSSASVGREAWWAWSGLTASAAVGIAVALPWMGRLPWDGVAAWFLLPVLWLLLAVPATLGVYGSSFRGGLGGGLGGDEGAGPGSDGGAGKRRAMVSVWGVLTAGVFVSLGAGLLANAASPSIWPGALMLMLLVLVRPSAAS